MTDIELEKMAAELVKLNERELIELLTRVFDAHAKRFDTSGSPGDRYALTRSSFEVGIDRDPYVEFLGVPSDMYWTESHDEALENGKCPTCSVVVGCVNKLATCPVCGTRGVQCT